MNFYMKLYVKAEIFKSPRGYFKKNKPLGFYPDCMRTPFRVYQPLCVYTHTIPVLYGCRKFRHLLTEDAFGKCQYINKRKNLGRPLKVRKTINPKKIIYAEII